jgi:hypothetical protein
MRRRMYLRAWSALSGLSVRVAHLPGVGVGLNAVLYTLLGLALATGSAVPAVVGLSAFVVAVVGGELHMLSCRACCPDEVPEVQPR